MSLCVCDDDETSLLMMDDRNRRERIRPAHTHLDEDSCPAERAPKGYIGAGDVVHTLPPPLRVKPGCKGPAINRDLKPGRLPKSSSDGRLELMGSAERAFTVPHRPVRSLPRDHLRLPPPPVQTITDCPNQFNQFDESPPSRPAPEPASPLTRSHTSRPAWTQPSPSERGNVNTSSSSSHTSHRFSLDLESQDLDSCCERETSSLGKSLTESQLKRLTVTESEELSGCVSDSHVRKQQHHEWPRAKGEALGSFTNHSKPAQGLEDQNWYVGAVSRVDAEHALHLVNREGAFLVRDCSKNTTYEPLVLAVFYSKRVFNIQIRFSDETSKYSLGTGLRTNDRFDSVTDIIRFHSIFPIVLIDGRKPSEAANQGRQCVLMYPITKQDLTKLLK
ncbi:cytokine-dependent hematopoietic cell linker isoform X2 [Carassius gibelio]|uniref:cytokine-dependent hematopoietic cell linker isoform X2 n=1 Tax=Carassius gibelio TaxID=101364 RepID=UPI002278A9E3|nr:cytokine-dependent hematopoietic cell linker isoform X2 [Carassius gibelio]XP_052430402.1 cytokine-dependent hematopoietic cell linker isoform X2 [Carassius gibelio]XP_052430403.1 cytokine-dependent hematopoietic cell linker isoform X2 [Carassius gibelio]